MVVFYIAVLHCPPPELAAELRWDVQPNLDALSILFSVALLAQSHSWIVHIRYREIYCGAAHWQQNLY